jgi:DNA-binding protein YbaB
MTDPLGSPFGDAEMARAHVRSQVAAAQLRADALNYLADTIATTSATVRSANGEVSVTATASAAITGVQLNADALELQPDALGRLVTRTIADAQRAAAELAVAAAEESLGSENSVVASLRDEVDSRFPQIPDFP